MRILHLLILVAIVALLLAVAREQVGVVFLIIFGTGVAEVIVGTTAILNLFKTVGAIGKAESPVAYVEALAATALVLILATIAMIALLWAGSLLVRSFVLTAP